jgi:hypothetical protein
LEYDRKMLLNMHNGNGGDGLVVRLSPVHLFYPSPISRSAADMLRIKTDNERPTYALTVTSPPPLPETVRRMPLSVVIRSISAVFRSPLPLP